MLTIPILPAHFQRSLFFAFLLSLLAGCGSGSTGNNDSVANSTSNGSSDSTAGSLTVTISGLPATVGARIVLSGPNQYQKAVSQSETISALPAGSYTLSVGKVLVEKAVYGAETAIVPVTVSPGAAASATISYAAQGSLALSLQKVASGLSSPLFLTAPANDPRQFIVERTGAIRIMQSNTLLPTAFLDLQERTTTEGERGLLSLAFHPQYATNGFFFVCYTALNGDIIVERFKTSASDTSLADPSSGTVILSIPHSEFNNHNGGLLSFGPDGYLYLGTGDGGGSGDQLGNAQNTNSLLGKILRIDVDTVASSSPYAIPPTNPFVNQNGKRPEIWAFGLRNPWRYAFDSVARQLYIADVGQERREEIDISSLDQAGLNYGWNRIEGTRCYPEGGTACNQEGLTLPAFEYDHGSSDSNGCSITGGYVYRGASIPELQGRYFYSDLCAGGLKSLFYANGIAGEQVDWGIPGDSVAPVYSFGQDAQNELYLLSGSGDVYRLVRQ
jgi:glucose/arabinose dehydrogenase